MPHQARNTNTATCLHPETLSGIVSLEIFGTSLQAVLTINTATVKSGSPQSSAGSGRPMPAFATLTNDEDRERKAETNLPGTYSVVFTPSSFADLPEYAAVADRAAARDASSARQKSRAGSGSSNRKGSDPNVVVLDRFEDLSPTTSVTSGPAVSPIRSGTLPETLQHMSLNVPPSSYTSSQPSTPTGYIPAAEGRLILHFRRYIVTRLVPRNIEYNYGVGTAPLRDIFENESAKFPPVSTKSKVSFVQLTNSVIASPCYMCLECTQPELSWPSYPRRGN